MNPALSNRVTICRILVKIGGIGELGDWRRFTVTSASICSLRGMQYMKLCPSQICVCQGLAWA